MIHEEHKEIILPSGKTTMVDIYEAAGGTVNEDRTQVSINSTAMRPFEIKLLVYPTAVAFDSDGERVTFGIILHDDVAVRPGYAGGTMRHIQYDEEVTLPVSQVQILKKESM